MSERHNAESDRGPMMDPNPETTAAIARIDRELSQTFQGIARLNDDIGLGRIRCAVCDESGIHTHATPVDRGES